MIVIKKYSFSDHEDYINREINEFIHFLENDESVCSFFVMFM